MAARGTKVLTVTLIIIILAVGAGGYFGWQAYQALSDENAQQASNVDSLRRQLAEAKSTPTATPAPSAAPTPIPAVTLKEFSVSFTPSAEAADVTATYVAASKTFGFTSATLAKGGGECATPGALGSLTRVAKGKPGPADNAKVATVGAYDYYLSTTSAGCAKVSGAAQVQTAQYAALKTSLAQLH